MQIHRLVALAFFENKEGKPIVNHINFNRLDNRLENLEWVTDKENVNHSRERCPQLFDTRGENVWNSKLTETKVLEIRKKFIPRVYTRDMLAEEYNVKASTIKDVILRRSWTHV